jgi:hypothetical protein
MDQMTPNNTPDSDLDAVLDGVHPTPNTPDDDLSDLLDGVDAIAKHRGVKKRRVSYLIERNLIPFSREGGRIFSRKSWLRDHYARPTHPVAKQT